MTEEKYIEKIFKQRIEEVNRLVNLTNKSSVLVIQQFPTEKDTEVLIPNVRESISNVMAFIELGTVDILKLVLNLSVGIFDNIIFDSDVKCEKSTALISFVKRNVTSSKLFFYSDNNTWADSAIKFLQQVSNGVYDKTIFLAGNGILYKSIKTRLKDCGVNFVTIDEVESVDVIIGASIKEISIDENSTKLISKKTKIYDFGIGNFSADFLKKAIELNADIYRIDNRAGISSTILNLLETDYLIRNMMGKAEFNGVGVVAGGIMGKDSDIVIDDINQPKYVIGVADGKGFLKNNFSQEEEKNLNFINRLINP